MKVLFLDIDGVCNSEATINNSHKGVIGIDPYMAFLVGKIQLDTGCEVVLSSSWRTFPKGREEVEKSVVKLYDITPRQHDGVRGWEIREWLGKHPEVTRFAILDDDIADQLLIHKDNFFKTSWKTGLTDEIAKAVTDYLNVE